MRIVHTQFLPKHTNGRNKGRIDWNQSIGKSIPFEFEDKKGSFLILSYKNPTLTIEYNNNRFNIKTNELHRCRIAKIIGWTKQAPFKYDVGDIISNKHIIKRYRVKVGKDQISKKFYDCICNKCGHKIIHIEECNMSKNNCKSCHSLKTIHPEISKYVLEDCEEIGCFSNKIVSWRCPFCNQLNKTRVCDLVKREGWPCKFCSDGFSYGEKIINNVMRQISNTYETQKKFLWSDDRKYDVFDRGIFIEMNGEQHERNGFSSIGGRTVEEEKQNDAYKEYIARKYCGNFVDYIVIKSDYKDFNYIKTNIINSRLNIHYDLKTINWDEVYTSVNNRKLICDVAEKYNMNYSNQEISDFFKISISTVSRYLQIANKLKLCKYDPYRKHKRMVRCKNNNMIFQSVQDAAKWCGLKSSSAIGKCANKMPKYNTAGRDPMSYEKLLWEYIS